MIYKASEVILDFSCGLTDERTKVFQEVLADLKMSIPPFWGDVGVKKWSPFLDLGARCPMLGT